MKGSPNVHVETPSVQTPSAPTNAMSKNSWIQFNREMGAGRFTKDKFGGSSRKANEAKMRAYDQWKANN